MSLSHHNIGAIHRSSGSPVSKNKNISKNILLDMTAPDEELNIIGDGDGEEENLDDVHSVKIKPTKEQYEKIGAFYEVHNEEIIEKKVFNELWGNLAAQLNDIGPPAFTEAEWRRKWSIRKYNNKKRRLKTLAIEVGCDEVAHSTAGTNDVQLVLEKLEQISTKQDEILDNQSTILNCLTTLQALSK